MNIGLQVRPDFSIAIPALVIALMAGCSPTFTGRSEILEKLKDPNSAEFRNVDVSTFNDLPLVCGEVNSKNSSGGYVGFRHFMIKEGLVYLAANEIASIQIDGCCYISAGQAMIGKSSDWIKRHEDACNTLEVANSIRLR